LTVTRHFDGPVRSLERAILPYLAEGSSRRDKTVWIYGRGNLGTLASDFFRHVGEPVGHVFDQFTLTAAARHPGRADVAVAVAIITSPYAPIAREMTVRGFGCVMPFYDLAWRFRDKHPLGENGWTADPLTTDDQDKVTEVWNRWGDDVSRSHHLQFLAWRLMREEWTFADAPVSNEDRYFIPEVVSVLHDHEVFVDGGAYHGDVSRWLMGGGPFRSIVSYEPDPDSAARMRSLGRAVNEFALANYDGVGELRHGFGYASRLGSLAKGGTQVQVAKIDSLGDKPTFIKLHLEGGELAALRGARETLQKHRPIVAATVYHNYDGIWRTADWLMNTLEDYRFLFRNHCWCGAGAVVYAIPNERKPQ